jgi:PTS system ascorbate-specific IIB component
VKKYQIGVCCTFGAGSSMMLKMNLSQVLKKMGLDANVEVYDISGVTSVELDAIYTSAALAQQVASSTRNVIVIPVVNYFDPAELEDLTKKHLLAAGQ